MTEREFTSFEESLSYIDTLVGDDFLRAAILMQHILDNPHEYTGQQANMTAVKLSIYRCKIGKVAQDYKQKSAETKKRTDRLIKDALLVTYDGLQEVINCLKAIGRDHREFGS